MKEKLNKETLLQLLDKIMQPKLYALSESESDSVLLAFCAGCPDPLKARWLIVECLEPMTDEASSKNERRPTVRISDRTPFKDYCVVA